MRGAWRPEQTLSSSVGVDFLGQDVAGTWTLLVIDDATLDVGTWITGRCWCAPSRDAGRAGAPRAAQSTTSAGGPPGPRRSGFSGRTRMISRPTTAMPMQTR